MGTYTGEGTVATGEDLTPVRQTDKYVGWLENEFKPLTLATPTATQEQFIENAIRYWNTHSGYKWIEMVDYTPGQKRAQLSTNIKTVVQIYPSKTTTWIWNDLPLWTMLGITVLDNVTSDLIMMSEAFRSYKVYVSSDFRWTHVKSEDPSVGSYIYAVNVPHQTEKLCIVGTKRVTATEDIKQEYILDWILQYAKTLLMICEGNTLRKSGIIGVKNDGQELCDAGFAEKEKLEEKLAKDSRWVALIRRF